MNGNNAARWNRLDSIIFNIEKVIYHIWDGIRESRERLPDPEEMISAATEQLQKENDTLKKLQDPGEIVCSDGKFYCPHCHELIANELVKEYHIKFCPECGKRIVLSIPYPYI